MYMSITFKGWYDWDPDLILRERYTRQSQFLLPNPYWWAAEYTISCKEVACGGSTDQRKE